MNHVRLGSLFNSASPISSERLILALSFLPSATPSKLDHRSPTNSIKSGTISTCKIKGGEKTIQMGMR
ncbi:hypothetical protein OUZ56_031719 [Daphnia magna]|uniref:Uncharacterized protein n=1 Tax=Daphnia magna TaxID=35525 RepID=A0ABQ9ZV10_9CRUS|nr:hypothetical protein OUZ56_031719 [Daphnia magna]